MATGKVKLDPTLESKDDKAAMRKKAKAPGLKKAVHKKMLAKGHGRKK